MNEDQKRLIENKLNELVDLLSPIGPQFKLQTLEVDEEGRTLKMWDFDIFSYETTDEE